MSAYNHCPIIKYADEPKHVQQHMQKYCLSEIMIRDMRRGRPFEGRPGDYVNTIGMTKEDMRKRGVVPAGWQEQDEDELAEWRDGGDEPWNKNDYNDSDDEDEELPVIDRRLEGGRAIIKRVTTTTITTTEIRVCCGRLGGINGDSVRDKTIYHYETKTTTSKDEKV